MPSHTVYKRCPGCSFLGGAALSYCPRCGEKLVPDDRIVAGKYLLVTQIGQGGMGRVYEATEPEMGGRKVALKLLSPHLASDPVFVKRLSSEAQIAASVRHPNIVVVHGISAFGEEPAYLCMEFLEGRTLAQVFQEQGSLPYQTLLSLLIPVVDALCACHGARVEHRDLKPDNLYWERDPQGGLGRLKILDFGIAHAHSSAGKNSKALPFGTLTHSAPERLADLPELPGKADVFSIGVVLYEGLVGKLPFAVSAVEVLQGGKPNLLDPRLKAHPALAELLRRMLEGDPALRPSMVEVSQGLRRVLAQAETQTRRHRLVVPGVALLLLSLAMAVGTGLFFSRRQGDLRARALEVLKEGIADRDATVRLSALSALALAREARQGTLIVPLLRDPDKRVQAEAARVLGDLGEPLALEGLLAYAPEDEKGQVERAFAMARLGREDGVSLLRRRMLAGDVRAFLALCTLRDPQGLVRLSTYGKRGDLPDQERLLLLSESLRHGEGDPEKVRAEMRRFLGSPKESLHLGAAASLLPFQDEAAKDHLNKLATQEGPLQLQAIRILAGVGHCKDIGVLRKTLSSPKSTVAEQGLAASALSACGSLSEDGELFSRYLDPKVAPEVRLLSAGAVLHLATHDRQTALDLARGTPADSQLSVLASLLSGEEARIADLRLLLSETGSSRPGREARLDLLAAARRAPKEAAIPSLLLLLQDPDREVQLQSAEALLGLREALAKSDAGLLRLLESPEPSVRDAAGLLLSALGKHGQGDRLTKGLAAADPQIRLLSVALAGAPEALALTSALADPDARIRSKAARRLVALLPAGGDTARPRIIEVLKEEVARGGPEGLIAYALLRHRLKEEVIAPKGVERDIVHGSLPLRFALCSAAAELPNDEAMGYLYKGLFDRAAVVRRVVAEVAYGIFTRDRYEPARQILSALSGDPDLALRLRVRTMLRALATVKGVSQEPQPEQQNPAQPTRQTKDPAQGYLLVQSEVRFQIDRGAPHNPGSAPIPVAPGRHVLRFLLDRSLRVQVAAGQTLPVSIPASQVEQVLLDAREARLAKRYQDAEALLTQALSLLKHKRKMLGGHRVELGLLRKAQGRLGEAMEALDEVDKLSPTERTEEALASARSAMEEIGPELGLGKVLSCCDQGGYKESISWGISGQQMQVKVCNEMIHVRVQRGRLAKVGRCR